MDIFITKEYIMKKIIRLTESDLARIVRRVISEQDGNPHKEGPAHKEFVHNTESVKITPSQEIITSINNNETVWGNYKVLMGKIVLQSSSSKEIGKISIPQGFTKTNGSWAYQNGKITLI